VYSLYLIFIGILFILLRTLSIQKVSIQIAYMTALLQFLSGWYFEGLTPCGDNGGMVAWISKLKSISFCGVFPQQNFHAQTEFQTLCSVGSLTTWLTQWLLVSCMCTVTVD